MVIFIVVVVVTEETAAAVTAVIYPSRRCHWLSLPVFELFLCSSHVVAASPTAADDDDDNYDDDDYVDAYDLAPNATFFVVFQNQFLLYHLIP